MLDFLRMLAPQHTDALRPASTLRRPSTSNVSASDASQALVDEASKLSPSHSAQSSSGAGPATMADHAMMTTADSVAPQRARRVAQTSAEIEALSARPFAMPTGEVPTPHRDAAGAVEPSAATAPQGIAPRHIAASLATDSQFQPVRRSSPSNRIESLPERSDRLAKHDQAAASSLPPLSPATVALYAAPSSERDAAPAIHVTIDRIEVRTPAAASRPSAGKRREPAQTQTLGDYLRGNSKVTQ